MYLLLKLIWSSTVNSRTLFYVFLFKNLLSTNKKYLYYFLNLCFESMQLDFILAFNANLLAFGNSLIRAFD